MTYDKTLAKSFDENLHSAKRKGELLKSSITRMRAMMPLKTKSLDSLDETSKDMLDAFRVRFSDLQDILGGKVFRTLLLLEEEKLGSQLDIINKIVKRRIIDSFDEWKHWREVRNVFSHDYPEAEQERIEALNLAYALAPKLISVLSHVENYVNEKLK